MTGKRLFTVVRCTDWAWNNETFVVPCTDMIGKFDLYLYFAQRGCGGTTNLVVPCTNMMGIVIGPFVVCTNKLGTSDNLFLP